MRAMNLLVYDDFIAGTPPTTVITKPELNQALGSHDLLALAVIADQVSVAGNITVQVFHSADQLNWTAKNPAPEINSQPISTTTTNVFYGGDGGTVPSLGFIRLSITLATTTQAHVKVWVTGRDAD